MEINELIQEKRIELGLSIRQLAKISQVSASHISRIEQGIRHPSPKILKKLSTALELDYAYLLKLAFIKL